MSHLKISSRLMLLIAFSAALLVTVGGLGLWSNAKSSDSLHTLYGDRLVPAGQLSAIGDRLSNNRIALLRVSLNPTPDAIAKGVAGVEANLVEANRQWGTYTATSLTPEEKRLADEFTALREKYLAEVLRPALAALKSNDTAQARKLLLDVAPVLVAPLEAKLAALMQLQLDLALADTQAAAQRYDTARTLSIGIVGLGVLLSSMLGLFIIRGIRRELGTEPGAAANMLGDVAHGDLSAHIDVPPGDTTSLLARLAEMQRSLVGVVSNVRQNSESVATASAQIAQGNLDLSQRTEEQASALQQTAASMEQLGATVKQNADNARQANQLALGASTVAIKGGEVVSQVVTTMKGINESSKKIADIISVIDGIAFQTNILALNAAVEAARAGEQGRGFAVVASEVRSLAGRSADAAREIKNLINASVVRVEHGTALVDQAGVTMTEVVSSIKRVTDIMGEISAASTEQSAGVAQVSEALGQMDQVTQQNAALVEESAAAAESLKLQANQLVQAVAVFKLSAAGHGTSGAANARQPAPAVASKPAWNSGERRSPDRAKNVARPRFGARAQPAAASPGTEPSPHKNGTHDDWTTF